MTVSEVHVDPTRLPTSVVCERSGDAARARLVLRAREEMNGFATGWFATPAVAVGLTLADVSDVLGLAFTQFALPVVADATLAFDFAPAPNLHSPPALGALVAAAGGRFVLAAPIERPHEQILAVADGRLSWGWHGDLDEVPAGFSTTLGIYAGGELQPLLDDWARDVRGDRPVRATTNPIATHLSYWTDNGAAYWYRTEAGHTIGASVTAAVEALRAADVPIVAVELDSWCYDHEVPRPITEVGYPDDVPPSGLLRWTPRADAFDPPPPGRDAIEAFGDRLDAPPLVIHSRHISPASPYIEPADRWWVDDLAAQPIDPTFFRRWFDDARRWRACAIEQDWMLLYWFGVRALRAAPDRAVHWQRMLDTLAAESGVDLIWCMATPADLVAAATLDHVVAVRTSDDYRFAPDPALLWTWYLTVNRFVGALGLRAFKDCFFSLPDTSGEAIDGDPHAEVEALLACMSAGPVGIGDRIGRTDRDIVMRTCDADGRIRHVDTPLALIDRSLFGGPARGDGLAWATTTASRGPDTWTYVVALNTATEHRTIGDELHLAEVGLGVPPRAVYEWRTGEVRVTDAVRARLAPRDWALWVCPPAGRPHDLGDTTKYVTVAAAM